MRCLVLRDLYLAGWLHNYLESISICVHQVKEIVSFSDLRDLFDVIFIIDLDTNTSRETIDGLRQHSPGAPIVRIEHARSASIGEDYNIYLENGIFSCKDFNHQIMLAFRAHALNALTNSVAHEINNRLTPILGKAQIMSNSPRTPGDMKEGLGIIHGESLKIHDFINEIDRTIKDPKFRYEHQRVSLV